MVATGARVRNAYATYLIQKDTPEKFGIILHSNLRTPVFKFKAPAV